MKKFALAPIALSLLVVALTGCGDGEDAIFGSGGGNNSNELTLSSFDNSYDNQANGIAIARIDEVYRTGERRVSTKNIINSYDNRVINDLNQIVLANDFEGTLENRNIEVNGRTVKRPIYKNNSNQKLNFETNYKTIDLSGIKANNNRGIITDLNNYLNISANAEFPAGSICYIPVTTSERSFIAFNAKNETNYRTLNDWVQATENRFGNNRNPRRTTSSVGNNNQYRLEQVTFLAVNNEPEYLYNGVDYNNRIYETEYTKSGTNSPNENGVRGVVDCTLVNDRAADFLEDQIARGYRR